MNGPLSLIRKISDIILDHGTDEGILSEPGDRLEARVTKSNRKVAKLRKKHGKYKESITEYSNGTKVYTKSEKL